MINNLHGVLLCEFSLGAQIGEELTARDISHEEEKEAGVLREPLQADLSTIKKKATRVSTASSKEKV